MATAHPQEPAQDESLLQPREFGKTHRLVAMTEEKAKRHPASGPSLQHMTTRKLPAVHTDTTPVRWTRPEPEGWSTRPLGC